MLPLHDVGRPPSHPSATNLYKLRKSYRTGLLGRSYANGSQSGLGAGLSSPADQLTGRTRSHRAVLVVKTIQGLLCGSRPARGQEAIFDARQLIRLTCGLIAHRH